jgi:hypothetical protein
LITVEVEWRAPHTGFRVCFIFHSVVNDWFVNLRLDDALRSKAEDRQLERAGRVMWKADTSKVVAPAYVS